MVAKVLSYKLSNINLFHIFYNTESTYDILKYQNKYNHLFDTGYQIENSTSHN